MRAEGLLATDVDGARVEILDLIQSQRDIAIIAIKNNASFYLHTWSGFGKAAVLTSMAQFLRSREAPHPFFGTTIYIDCTRWESKRVMQRKIAEELKLDSRTMAMFHEQDEEDDFNGVNPSSRDVILDVSAVIARTVPRSRFTIIFLNGSDGEIPLSRFGIPEYHDCIIIWAFTKRLLIRWNKHFEEIQKAGVKNTDIFLTTNKEPTELSDSHLTAVLREEATTIVARHPWMRGIDLAAVTDCYLYGLLIMYHSSFSSASGIVCPAHAPNYWICDGIIGGDRAWEINNALRPEISIECDDHEKDWLLASVFRKLNKDPKIPFLLIGDDDHAYGHKSDYRWVSIIRKNKKVHMGMQDIFTRASSIFLAFDEQGTKDSPSGLPNGLFERCNNLGVLVLSHCAFSFVSPPFLHCHTLTFLGLSHCTTDGNNNASAEVLDGGRGSANRWWASCLQSLLVFDLYYTDWVEILSEEKLELMANLMELNIEGISWTPRWAGRLLQEILPNLRRLRIIRRPKYDEAVTMSSDGIGDSLFRIMDTTSLEVLDLSGSSIRGTGRNLTASIPQASNLQALIIDGCDGLEGDVIISNSSLRSFSFDGYGPASQRTSTDELLPPEMSRPKHPPPHAADDKQGCTSVVKTSIISLEGCMQLDKLFLRGLPNLVELDLSGCAIKVLDFGAMVVDVPMLKRLFLLGCECLHAIAWGSYEQQSKLQKLELICIDTRPWSRRPSLGNQQQSFQQLGVHAVFTDARFARSLWGPIAWNRLSCFNISITSSAAEATRRRSSQQMMAGRGRFGDRQRYCAAAGMYADVLTKATSNGSVPTMQVFPKAPTAGQQGRSHIEIGDGSCNVQSEVEVPYPYYSNNMATLMIYYVESLHVHDVSAYSNTMPAARWFHLRWCHVERCPNLHAVFPWDSEDCYGELKTIWASDLLMARCVWSKGAIYDDFTSRERFKSLRHLHLRRCPSLRFALAMGLRPSFPSLETLHIIHCGDLRHIFVPGDEKHQHPRVQFPKLTTIHLHDVPALREICEAAVEIQAPALETIKIRGCFNLRRLPALKGREPGMTRPAVEMEKDVWDALEWDGVDAGHHPSLYEPPVHSRYYRRRRILRGTVLK